MNRLTELQRNLISKICDIQLMSLKQIFLKGKESIMNEVRSSNQEVIHEEFLDTLLDTSNYFLELKENPDLIFDIDEDDVTPVLLILNHLMVADLDGNKDAVELLSFLKENSTQEIEDKDVGFDIESIEHDIEIGEDYNIEFKPSILYNFTKQRGTQSTQYYIAKTICGFLNTIGGVLYIGVLDNGEVQGLDYDYNLFEGDIRKKRDLFKLTFDNLIKHYFGSALYSLIKLSISKHQGKDIGRITVDFSSFKPVFLLNRERNKESGKYDIVVKEFYVRGGSSTRKIEDIEDIIEYVRNKWNVHE